jgi:hypothetical protein
MGRKHLWTTAALLLAAGCSRDEVAHYRVPKADPTASSAQGAAGAMGTGSSEALPPPPDASSTGTLRWVLPKGWTESRSSGGMRYATLTGTAKGKLDLSVTVFPGPAGGELANVNRWRNQIGLPPVEEAALSKDRKTLKSPAGPVAVFDYTSDGKDGKEKTRLVAGILFAGGNSWFVKMVGDTGPVAASRADFVKLLETLRLADR